jgi:hypothetical protein
VAGLLLAVTGVGAGGCGSGRGSTPTTRAPGTTSSSPTATTTTVAAGTVAHCRTAQLSGSIEGSQGAAGTLELTLSLRNSGPGTCALQGYPGALLVDASGTPLPTDVVRGGASSFTDFAAGPVVLAAGQVAYLNIGYSDVPAGAAPCEQASSLWVTPPDDVTHLVLSVTLTACGGGRLTVSPVFAAGSAGSQTTAPPSQ